FTLASKDLRLAASRCNDLDYLTIRTSADTLRSFAATCTQALCFGKAFSTHTLIGLLRDLCRQVGTTNTDVNDLEAKRRRIRTQLVANLTHHRRALFRERRFKAAKTVYPTQSRIETGAKALFGKRDTTGHREAEPARVCDAIGDERVHFVEATTGDLHADIVEIEAQDAVLDQLDVV